MSAYRVSAPNAPFHPEYTDDTTMVPRSSSILVKRLPAAKPGKGTAQNYVTGAGWRVAGSTVMTTAGPANALGDPAVKTMPRYVAVCFTAINGII